MPKHEQYLNDDFAGESRPQRMRRRFDEEEAAPTRKGRLTLEEKARLAIARENADMLPPEGDRWTTWGDAGHGPDRIAAMTTLTGELVHRWHEEIRERRDRY